VKAASEILKPWKTAAPLYLPLSRPAATLSPLAQREGQGEGLGSSMRVTSTEARGLCPFSANLEPRKVKERLDIMEDLML
jgi:hypothetical protein